jgi:hypothetical protein
MLIERNIFLIVGLRFLLFQEWGGGGGYRSTWTTVFRKCYVISHSGFLHKKWHNWVTVYTATETVKKYGGSRCKSQPDYKPSYVNVPAAVQRFAVALRRTLHLAYRYYAGHCPRLVLSLRQLAAVQHMTTPVWEWYIVIKMTWLISCINFLVALHVVLQVRPWSLCVCVCVCVRERERERERARVGARVFTCYD